MNVSMANPQLFLVAIVFLIGAFFFVFASLKNSNILSGFLKSFQVDTEPPKTVEKIGEKTIDDMEQELDIIGKDGSDPELERFRIDRINKKLKERGK